MNSEASRSRRTDWRWVLLGLAAALTILAVVGVLARPVGWASCLITGRDGWTIEFPRDRVTQADFEEAVSKQTKCVGVEVTYVNTDTLPDGFVVRPVGARDWVPGGGSVRALIESPAGPGVIECGEPLDEGSGAVEVLSC